MTGVAAAASVAAMQDPARIHLDDDDTTAVGDDPPVTGVQPTVLDLGERDPRCAGHTVTVRPWLSFAAQKRIDAAALAPARRNRRQRRSGDESMSWVPDPLGHAAATVEEGVIAWTLTDIDGVPLPPDGRGVRNPKAPAQLVNAAVEAVSDHFDPPPSDDDDDGDPMVA